VQACVDMLQTSNDLTGFTTARGQILRAILVLCGQIRSYRRDAGPVSFDVASEGEVEAWISQLCTHYLQQENKYINMVTISK
jgi:hypothetical protein